MNMKIKREYLILGMIIVVLSVYLIFRSQDRSFYDLPKLPIIARDDISKIEITKKENSITLQKKNTAWHIKPEDYLADKTKINSMLNSIEKLALTALVSESKSYDIYHLSDNKKITVKAWTSDGTLLREFDIGKTVESYRHTHVKLPNDHRVYHASTNIKPTFDQTMEDLRDKTVLSFNKNEIKEIVFTQRGQKYTFVKKESEAPNDTKAPSETKQTPQQSQPVWEKKGKGPVDQKRLESMLDVLSKLTCEQYIYGKQKDELKYPAYRIVLKGNQEHVLTVFPKKRNEDKNRPCTSSGSDQPFEIPEYQAKHFMESLVKN